MNQKSVSLIITLQVETGFKRAFTYKRKERCGRRRKITATDYTVFMRNSKPDSRKNSLCLQKDLQHSGLQINATTVRSRLLEIG